MDRPRDAAKVARGCVTLAAAAFFAVILVVVISLGVLSWKTHFPGTNREYLRYLASIVMRYRTAHGALPEGFEQAHTDSGIILPNRGDKYGRGLSYIRCDDRAFFLRSVGANHREEQGLGDDESVYWIDANEVDRETFVRYLTGKTSIAGSSWTDRDGAYSQLQELFGVEASPSSLPPPEVLEESNRPIRSSPK